MEINTQGSNTNKMREFQLRRRKSAEPTGKIIHVDLGMTDVIEGSSQVLNSPAEEKELMTVLRPNPDSSSYIHSDPDVDCQMLIKLNFREPVSLSSLILRAEKGPKDSSPPLNVKLFRDRKDMDFNDAEDTIPAQVIELDEKNIAGEKIPLKAIKFQRINSLQIFCVDNRDDADVTFLNRIAVIGRLSKNYHTI